MQDKAQGCYLDSVKRTSYDKQAVIVDIAENILKPQEIADKYGITVENVYNIKAVARKQGILNSRGYRTISQRMKEEGDTLTPELRERIKDLREAPEAYTSTEIAQMLGLKREDVVKVTARGANEYVNDRPQGWGKNRGKPRVQVVDIGGDERYTQSFPQ